MSRATIISAMMVSAVLDAGAGVFTLSVIEHATKVALGGGRRPNGDVIVALPIMAALALPTVASFLTRPLPRGSRYAGAVIAAVRHPPHGFGATS